MECRETTHVGDSGGVENNRPHPTLHLRGRGILFRDGGGNTCAFENVADRLMNFPPTRGDKHGSLDERLAGRIAAQLDWARHTGDLELHAASRMATTPWPPAAQIEMRPRPDPFSASSLASVATTRPPVAANGWPAASEEPVTFRRERSIGPSGFDRPRRAPENARTSPA